MTMMFFTVLLLVVASSYGQNYDLPDVCEDDPICSIVFTVNPADNINQCYDYTTSRTCCATCKGLIGKLGNTDPVCPWGNAGYGILANNGRMNCVDLTATDCFYCAAGQLFRTNCCQSCADICPNIE